MTNFCQRQRRPLYLDFSFYLIIFYLNGKRANQVARLKRKDAAFDEGDESSCLIIINIRIQMIHKGREVPRDNLAIEGRVLFLRKLLIPSYLLKGDVFEQGA